MSWLGRYALWILSVGGMLLFFLLLLLPREVVDNSLEEVAATSSNAEAHALPLDFELRLQLASWKAAWQSAHAAAETTAWRWADTIAYTYLRYNRLDTALSYIEALRRAVAPEAQRRAALHLYQAQLLAVEDARTLALGRAMRQQVAHVVGLGVFSRRSLLDLQVKSALTHVRGAHPMEGIQLLKGLEKQHPEAAEPLLALGRLSFQSGQYKKGEERLRKLLRLYPLHVEGMLYLGNHLLAQGKAAEGRDLLLRARDLTSDVAMLEIIDKSLQNP